ncbi:MAG: MBL fold metallo-hydrolase [Desulfobacterales bacterium]|nr:MAG: MBL fold metallo-hydrolase [Desulfobacterales bacterium]
MKTISALIVLLLAGMTGTLLNSNILIKTGRTAKEPTMNKYFGNRSPISIRNLSLTIVYDNNPYKEGLLTSWGFSCLIRGTEKTILFDSGGNGSVLIANMRQLGIDPEEIDIIVLSHIHRDHTGGLEECIKKNKKVRIYFPHSFPQEFQSRLQNSGVKTTQVHDAINICRGVYSTGLLGSGIKEQSVVINTDKGIIVITGCAHPGIVKIINTAGDLIGADILLVMGGFHLAGMNKPELEEIVLYFRRSGVKHVGPCHCSGDLSRQLFKNEYGNDFINVGVGRIIRFE